MPALNIPDRSQGRLYPGTCSWKYNDWKDLIYEPGKTYGPLNDLPDYTGFFNSVEIDQWFWSLFPTGFRLRYLDDVPPRQRSPHCPIR